MDTKQKNSDTKNGTGAFVPPEVEQVVIYFIEKDCSKDTAMKFFNSMNRRGWKNLKGIKIKNWKQHAWAWILNLSIK